MAANHGPLVVADISGYTAFVAETELEHSRAILNELLEMLVRAIARYLRVGQIEGDAIFGVGERMPPRPIEWMQECFVQYQRRLRDIQEVTTCPCRACANVGSLSLKFVAHYGEWMRQRFGDKETFVGNDVNIVHRLLKNSVPSHEYLLVTSAFLERLPAGSRTGFLSHSERSELGEISGAYVDLAELRAQARSASERRLVESDHARLTLHRRYHTSHDRLWQALTSAAERQRWSAARPTRIDYRPGARGTLLGSEYHCEHGFGGPTVYRVVETAPPDRLTMVIRTLLALVWETDRVRDTGPGVVELERSFHWERAPGARGWLFDALQSAGTRLAAWMELRAIAATVHDKPAETPRADDS